MEKSDIDWIQILQPFEISNQHLFAFSGTTLDIFEVLADEIHCIQRLSTDMAAPYSVVRCDNIFYALDVAANVGEQFAALEVSNSEFRRLKSFDAPRDSKSFTFVDDGRALVLLDTLPGMDGIALCLYDLMDGSCENVPVNLSEQGIFLPIGGIVLSVNTTPVVFDPCFGRVHFLSSDGRRLQNVFDLGSNSIVGRSDNGMVALQKKSESHAEEFVFTHSDAQPKHCQIPLPENDSGDFTGVARIGPWLIARSEHSRLIALHDDKGAWQLLSD